MAALLGNYRFVSPDYFRTLGMVLTRGRLFTEEDRTRPVAVVTAQTASRLWPDLNPVGQRFLGGNSRERHEVVGVVADARILGLDVDPGLAAALSGCSLSNGRTQIVRVRSVPPDAQVWLDGERVGTTPLDVEVRRRNAGPALRIEKNGFAPAERILPREISGSGRSDLVFAGVLAVVSFIAGGTAAGHPGAVAASAGIRRFGWRRSW